MYKNIVVFFVFLIYLGIGCSIYTDYGISWDEPQSRMNGEVNLKYVSQHLAPSWSVGKFNNTPDLQQWVDRDYGVAFELPLYIIEKLAKPLDDRNAFLLRHLITFLFSALGVWCLYKIVDLRFQDWRLGILAASLLILTPRFFGEAFYNSKDIVFMAAFLMATYTMYRYVIHPSLKTAFIHSFATAFATDVRIIGCSILLLTFVASFCTLRTLKLNRVVQLNFAYAIFTGLFIIAMFPLLWSSPIENFIGAFKAMMNFRWDLNVLYLGEQINAKKLPWHYIIVWILITTPIMYLVLFVTGVIASIRSLGRVVQKRKVLATEDILDGLALVIFFGPILAGIVLKSTFYDGWRQMYFIYPSFLILSISGFKSVYVALTRAIYRNTFLLVIACSLAHHTYVIFQTHPLQSLYFNQLAGSDWRKSFEIDYWGLANKKALQYILDHDSRTHVSVSTDSATPLSLSLMMIDPIQAPRISLVDPSHDADYLVTNYRMTNTSDEKYLNTHTIFHQIKVMNEVVLTIYKLKN